MDRHSLFFTFIRNRVCEPTDLTGFFDAAGNGMPGYGMFHRFALINRPGEQPVKYDRVENFANSCVTRSACWSLRRRHPARHGRNHHSSGIFTFFSFEEGSNFVQNIRHYRTSFIFRREYFLLIFAYRSSLL